MTSKHRFFTRLDWGAFWLATAITFLVYFFTLGPSVGLEDSGELATAAANLGVPHPPGYPFWTFCSWIFCKLFGWVTYMGHPTPAWCVSLCSATFGAFAAGCTAMLICRSSRDFLGIGSDADPSPAEGRDAKTVNLLAFGGGVAGALTFSLSPVEWSQSTIVEIYSLNALFLMCVFLLSYRWMRKPTDRMLFATAFVFGLGLTNYQVLLFAIVPLALVIFMKSGARIAHVALMIAAMMLGVVYVCTKSVWVLVPIVGIGLYLLYVVLRKGGVFRDVLMFLIPVALTYQVLQIGQLVRADRFMQADAINKHLPVLSTSAAPWTSVLVLAIVTIVLSIAVAAVLRARGKSRPACGVALAGGGAGVLLMVFSATFFATAANWTGVEEMAAPLIEPVRYVWIGAFLAASVVTAIVAALKSGEDGRLTQGESAKFFFASVALAVVGVVLALMVPAAGDGGYMGVKYPWGKSIAIFLALIALLFLLGGFTRRGLAFAVPVAGVQIAAFLLLKAGALNGLQHPCSWYFGWPIAWNFILLALTWVVLPNGRTVAGAAFFSQLGVSFYAYMPVVSDLRNPPMNWGYPRTWEGFKHAIMRGQYEAIGIPEFSSIGDFIGFTCRQMGHYFSDVMVQFTDALVWFALVPFAVAYWVVEKARRREFWQWMLAALACFLMMSGLLILLANVKGDVQDGFIQKVKFISSHAMIALWIGYGLVFAAVLAITKLCKPGLRTKLALLVAAVMIVVAGVYPIVQNYTDERMVFELGGNEQNGHTFGWQFGAYQLEGANAIREQLVADEEPLPDPTWPPPMDKFSIFFGGTDPGRFVPTYMIYSADFRPDVYLITQNALADDTYMSVERDLYGDEIWIPSKEDSADAFNIYVDEVQRGVREANGDLKIENGRVQVTGALGVMEINGILTKMMHDHDRLRHSFYVEESYVIKWMYPYLSPHGLIMKLNANPTPYNGQTAARDRDFWDWYVRRLLDDPMYRRDFAGQKAFSKLRAAIAGLYNKQGRYREGAQAFREAVLLYPASPEATFRYVQETIVPFQCWDVGFDLMDYTDAIDPHNSRTLGMRNYITHVRDVLQQVSMLVQKRQQTGKLSEVETVVLANYYFDLGRREEAGALVKGVFRQLSDPNMLVAAGQMLNAVRAYSEAEDAYSRALRASPNLDVGAWTELAKLQLRNGKKSAAVQSFVCAVRLDMRRVEALLNRDQELQAVHAIWYQRQRQLQPQQPRIW